MIEKKIMKVAYMGSRQFKRGATEDLSVKKARKEVLEESNQSNINSAKQEKGESWTLVAHQIIGRERF
jgi:hypothetical protein